MLLCFHIRSLFFFLDAFDDVPLFHAPHGQNVTEGHVQEHYERSKDIFLYAVRIYVFAGRSRDLNEGGLREEMTRRKAEDTGYDELQDRLKEPTSGYLSVLEADRAQDAEFFLLLKQIRARGVNHDDEADNNRK